MPIFKVSQKAGVDLVEIGYYTQNKFGIKQRNKYLDLINTMFLKLSNEPNLGALCGDVRSEYHRFTVGKHISFIKITVMG